MWWCETWERVVGVVTREAFLVEDGVSGVVWLGVDAFHHLVAEVVLLLHSAGRASARLPLRTLA